MENNYNKPFSAEDEVKEESVVVEPVAVAEESPAVEEPVVEAPAAEAVVEAPAVVEPEQALGFTETGAIGSMAADGPKTNIKPASELGDKVALYSTSNVRWPEVGVLYKGYNIVDKNNADKWLSRSHVRLATPEEIEKAIG